MQINKVGKIYLVGDLHFGVDANSIVWLNHQKRFFNDILIPYIKETVQPGDILFQFGDIFETKHQINVNIFNNVMDLFYELAKLIPVYVLIGNHDTYYTDNNEIHSLKILYNTPNVHVFNKPEIIGINDKKLLIIPWITDFNEIMTLLEDNVGKADMVFSHFDVAGMSYDNGYPIQKGIDFSILKKYEIVISGHIHKPQVKDNFIYLGTPYHLDFGDIGQKKGLYTLDMPNMKMDFVRNDKSPEFKYIDIFDLLEMTDAQLKDICYNSFIKVKGPNSVIQHIQKDDVKNYIKELVGTLHKFDFDPFPDVAGSTPTILKFNLDIQALAKGNLSGNGIYQPNEINDIMELFNEIYNSSLEKTRINNE